MFFASAIVKTSFQKFGFSEKEADIIQDVLLTSDLFGIQSHGMQRMVRYHKGITNGLIKIDAKPEIVKETPISAVIDGHDGMGQLLGHKAMEMAIEKAKKSGVGIVSVRNSNHYGIAGYYAKMASDQGLIGFSCTNSEESWFLYMLVKLCLDPTLSLGLYQLIQLTSSSIAPLQ